MTSLDASDNVCHLVSGSRRFEIPLDNACALSPFVMAMPLRETGEYVLPTDVVGAHELDKFAEAIATWIRVHRVVGPTPRPLLDRTDARKNKTSPILNGAKWHVSGTDPAAELVGSFGFTQEQARESMGIVLEAMSDPKEGFEDGLAFLYLANCLGIESLTFAAIIAVACAFHGCKTTADGKALLADPDTPLDFEMARRFIHDTGIKTLHPIDEPKDLEDTEDQKDRKEPVKDPEPATGRKDTKVPKGR